jgi:hypothetical protein
VERFDLALDGEALAAAAADPLIEGILMERHSIDEPAALS